MSESRLTMEFDLSGLSVYIGVPVNRDFPWQTTMSLLETQADLIQRGIANTVKFGVGNSIVESARSSVVHEFLKTDHNVLAMIDSDMSWKPLDFVRMLCLITKLHIVGATYPAKIDKANVFFVQPETGEQEMVYGCLPIRGMGLGFTFVRREILENLADKAPLIEFDHTPGEKIAHIFRCDYPNGKFRGEDMAFFADVIELGYTPYLDPSVDVGHVGGKEYRASFMDAVVKVPEKLVA